MAIFFKRSLPGILSSFERTLRHLDELESGHSRIIDYNEAQLDVIEKENADLHAERNKARIVKQKIAALIAA